MKEELFFEGKKFISARRASEITGYTSDYIGQLCRGNKLECRQVGRGWFVSEVSVITHKKISTEKPRGTIVFPPTIQHSLESLPKEIKKTPRIDHVPLAALFNGATKQIAFYAAIAFLFVVMGCLITISYNKNAQIQVATISQKVISAHKLFIENTMSHAAKYVALVNQPVNASPLQKAAYNAQRCIGLLGQSVNKLALATYRALSGWSIFGGKRHFVLREPNYLDTGSNPDGRLGVAVVPSTGDENRDESTKQQIKDSFSDETKIIPDKSGTSGVIKPIFRSQSDQEYLYVVVPVRE